MSHTRQMLKRILFNLAGVRPETAGGVANVCQTFVARIPEAVPDAEAWALTGPGDWEHHHPLTGKARLLSIKGMNSRQAGRSVELAIEPSTTRLNLWLRSLQNKWNRDRRHRFPAQWSENTIIHCPYQSVHPLPPASWNLPYVINLHDVQHEHFPEFFTSEELAWRREYYLASADHATAICVVDEWTRRDVLAHLPIPESKVFVAPLGPTWPENPGTINESEASRVRALYNLADAFAFYPAQTWPHKNHARLFAALAHLRHGGGPRIPLVLTGHLNDYHPQLMAQADELGITDQVRFLGLVPWNDVHALFRMARMTVVPTLFEGGPGIPVLESMALGAPLAAAKTCGIPEAVGDAAVLFDPMDLADMAAAIARLWEDNGLRAELAQRGRKRMESCTWERVAATYVEIYRESLARWNSFIPR